jgi:hypothetical protein
MSSSRCATTLLETAKLASRNLPATCRPTAFPGSERKHDRARVVAGRRAIVTNATGHRLANLARRESLLVVHVDDDPVHQIDVSGIRLSRAGYLITATKSSGWDDSPPI